MALDREARAHFPIEGWTMFMWVGVSIDMFLFGPSPHIGQVLIHNRSKFDDKSSEPSEITR